MLSSSHHTNQTKCIPSDEIQIKINLLQQEEPVRRFQLFQSAKMGKVANPPPHYIIQSRGKQWTNAHSKHNSTLATRLNQTPSRTFSVSLSPLLLLYISHTAQTRVLQIKKLQKHLARRVTCHVLTSLLRNKFQPPSLLDARC